MLFERVKSRVLEGGHDILTDTIIRRYQVGLKNFLTLYRDKVDYWLLIDNSGAEPEVIAEGQGSGQCLVHHENKWNIINDIAANDER